MIAKIDVLSISNALNALFIKRFLTEGRNNGLIGGNYSENVSEQAHIVLTRMSEKY